nr:cytidylate kinase family protein [Coprococcus sp. AF21-14LB]
MKRVITINRTYGSDGREIGKALAVKLGIHYYDKQLLKIILREKTFHMRNWRK